MVPLQLLSLTATVESQFCLHLDGLPQIQRLPLLRVGLGIHRRCPVVGSIPMTAARRTRCGCHASLSSEPAGPSASDTPQPGGRYREQYTRIPPALTPGKRRSNAVFPIAVPPCDLDEPIGTGRTFKVGNLTGFWLKAEIDPALAPSALVGKSGT